MSEPSIREESASEGVIILRNVPLEPAESEDTGTIIYLRGVERGLGGFRVRAFLGADRAPDENLAADHPDYLGEILIYASMSAEVPEEQRPELPPGMPAPLPLDSYETFIDISRAESRFGDQPTCGLTLALTTLDGKPVPADSFRFSQVSIRTQRISRHPPPL